jgi:glycosyltransferase involved in cell wall biosynthesis
MIRSAEKVLTIGPALAEYTAERYAIPEPFVVRNCSMFKKIEPNHKIKEDLCLNGTEKLGVVIGAIYNNQGLEQLIRCLPYMGEDIHIAALGPESETGFIEYLTGLALESNVSSRFHILPPQPPHLLLNYAAGADVGIIARQNSCLNNLYSLPNKVFEMIMARLPIACSRLPNIQMIIEQYGIGKSFDETNPLAIARAIKEIVEDRQTLIKYKHSVERAALELCWENEGKKYVRFLENH